jgi:protein-disulfide isomerase
MSHQTPSPTKRERRDAARAARLERERAAAAGETRRRRLIRLGGLLAAAVVIVVIAVAVSSGGGGKKNAGSGGAVTGATTANQLMAGIPQRGITLGKADAPVTIAEFADPQCPFCRDFSNGQLPTIIDKYVRTGKAKLELHLLTFIGQDSLTAGRALAAASLQNKMWTATDLFYANQGEENSGYVTDAFLRRVLGGVNGLNVGKALTDAGSSKASQVLGTSQTLASRYGVDSTPTVLVGPSGGTLKPDAEGTKTAAGVGKMVDAVLAQTKTP